MEREVEASLAIEAYMHCDLCLDERPDDVSPQDWGRLEAGWTRQGLQLWCKRHKCNVIHIDFEGKKHPVNTHRLAPPLLKVVE